MTQDETQPLTRVANRILVAEDSESYRVMLRLFLEGLKYEVVTATDGESAWSLLQQQPFDLLITDNQMPGCTGSDLLQRIHEKHLPVRVILITGSPSLEAAVECVRIGAFDYLAKPVALDRLQERVEEVMTLPCRNGDSATRGFGSYHVLRTIGEGAQGIVFQVEKLDDPPPPRRFALKILRNAAAASSEVNTRFLHEAEAAARIQHPNVIRFVEAGIARDEKIPYFIMEFFPGISLSDFAQQHPNLTWQEKATILRQAADGLQAIHAAGVLHRDIKPSNLMVDPDTRLVKISDFGVARLPDSKLTAAANLLGTPVYMAPEAYFSSQITPAADIFSFGVLAYEFLTGQMPWPSVTSVVAHASVTNSHRPSAPHAVVPGFPIVLETLLERCLIKSPRHRLQSAAELSRMLASVSTGEALDNAGAIVLHPLVANVLRRLHLREHVWA